jgi:predicted XRE-type DNA-binding protein
MLRSAPVKSVGRRQEVTRGTANLFADLAFPDASERQARLRLAYALNKVLQERYRSAAGTAKVLGITRANVSARRSDKLSGFSIERLMKLFTVLDHDVQIMIRRRPRSRRGRPDHRRSKVVRKRSLRTWHLELEQFFRRFRAAPSACTRRWRIKTIVARSTALSRMRANSCSRGALCSALKQTRLLAS